MKQSIVYVVVGILSGGSRISREEGWALTYYYRLQTKLREDNVFTPVLLFCSQGRGSASGSGRGVFATGSKGLPPSHRQTLPGQTPTWADTP